MSNKLSDNFKEWVAEYSYRLTIFNIIIISLFLLRSAGYFHPYFPISVNFIVIFGLILSAFLLNANSRIIFLVVIVFWVFAGFLKIMQIDVWAERTGIYAFESLGFGVFLFILEQIKNKKNN